jgi:hypothetical protein
MNANFTSEASTSGPLDAIGIRFFHPSYRSSSIQQNATMVINQFVPHRPAVS